VADASLSAVEDSIATALEPSFALRLEMVLTDHYAGADAQVAALQSIMEHAGAQQLDELATAIDRLCTGNRVRAVCVPAFLWVREHLLTILGDMSESDRFERARAETYAKFKDLFDDTDLVPLIVAGRGAIESVLLRSAAECLRENRSGQSAWMVGYDCQRAFTAAYVKSVVVGDALPTQTHQLTALLLLGQQLYVGDYNGPTYEVATANAKTICDLMDMDFSSFVPTWLEPRGCKAAWFQLGVIYTQVVQYLAYHTDVEAARRRVESPWGRSSLPFAYLKVAVSCFNSGDGPKNARFFPPLEDWLACQRGLEMGHKQRCVAMAAQIQRAAAAALDEPDLSVDEKVSLAHAFNERLVGPIDRVQLAQTLVSAAADSGAHILPILELARALGGLRFGGDFYYTAIRSITGMTAAQRASLPAALAPLLEIGGDEDFVRDRILQVLPMAADVRASWIQMFVREAHQRAALRQAMLQLPNVAAMSASAAALVEVAGGCAAEHSEGVQQMCVAILGRVDAPELLVTQLLRHNERWANIAPLYNRLADVNFDSSMLSRQMWQLLNMQPAEREVFVTHIVAHTRRLASLKDALNFPEYARLGPKQRDALLVRLGSLPDVDQLTLLELCRPLFERLALHAAIAGMNELIATPVAQRLAQRNAILGEHERVDTENVMNARTQQQVAAAINFMRTLLPNGFPTYDARRDVIRDMQKHLLDYFTGESQAQLAQLLTAAAVLHAHPNRASVSRAAVSALQAAFCTRVAQTERDALMRYRACAPEIANAWRTLSGGHLPQDYSEALSVSRENLFAGTDMGDLAAMVWQLIGDFASYAKHNALHTDASIAQEQSEMRYSFVMALAQSIDEEHNHRVCGVGLSQRLCLVLQGSMRYKEINLDLLTPAQRFTAKLRDFYGAVGEAEVSLAQLNRFLQDLCEGASSDEQQWYRAELGRYCDVAGWPHPSVMF
jgi:hypothetical protein